METRVVILSPTALQREAWTALLSTQPDILVAGAVGDPAVAASLFTTGQPLAALIDFPVPRPELARHLRTLASDAGLLFLVSADDPSDLLLLLQSGATGVLSREASVGDLARALIACGRGEMILPPALATQLLVALARGHAEGRPAGEALTEREREVLGLLARGLTNKDIAQTLILSVRTVEAHLRNIFSKTGVRSRTEAALWAIRHGYAEEDR